MAFNTGYDPRGGHVNEKPNRASGTNPFVGTPYEQMYENNPYRDLYYEPTFWDNIGLSNKAKDANAEYDRLYNEYVAGLFDQQRQDSYNSPSAEAQRLKDAGINPNLSGLSGESNTDSMNAPNAGTNPALNGQSPASSSLQMMGQILSFATGSMKSISEILNINSNTDNINLTNLGKYKEHAHELIVNEYAKRFKQGPEHGDKAYRPWEDVKYDFVSYYEGSHREKKKAARAFELALKSSDFTASEQALKNLNANDKAMYDFIGKMVEFEFNAKRSGFQATTRENNNKGWLNKWQNEYYKTLYNDFKNGSDLAGLLLIGSAQFPQLLAKGALNLGQDDTKPWNKGINPWDSTLKGLGKLIGFW